MSRTGQRPRSPPTSMGIELGDVFVDPEAAATSGRRRATKDELDREDGRRARREPCRAVGFSFTQPIEMRFNELIAGVRSDVAVKLFGDDLDALREQGEEIARVLAGVPGAARREGSSRSAGLPVRAHHGRPRRAARATASPSRDVLDAVEAARAGKVVGTVFEGQRRFDLVGALRPTTGARRIDALAATCRSPLRAARSIPLGQLAEITRRGRPGADQPREPVQPPHRRRDATCAAATSRASSPKPQARARGARSQLPPGYFVRLGRAVREPAARRSARLAVVVPLALLLIFVLLYTTFGAARPAAAHLPERADRGDRRRLRAGAARPAVLDLGRRRLHRALRRRGAERRGAHVAHPASCGARASRRATPRDRGAEIRLRPVLMTALVARLGFVPMALSTSAGRRGPASARHRRHRRPRHLDRAHAPGATCTLRLDRAAANERRGGWGSPRVTQRGTRVRDGHAVSEAHRRSWLPRQIE